MSVSAEVLRELHRIHRQLADLKGRLASGPRQLKVGEQSLAQAEASLETAKEQVRRTRMSADERQLQLKQREDRIENLKAKLNAAASNREYQALKEQIAADLQANSVLADEILESLERIDELQAVQQQAQVTRERAAGELDAIRERVAGQQAQLEAELGRVQTNLAEVEAGLPADFKPEYLRITKARGEEAMAEVQGECCGGCYQTLTPQTMNDLYLGKLIFCKSCGCLLYLPENRAPA